VCHVIGFKRVLTVNYSMLLVKMADVESYMKKSAEENCDVNHRLATVSHLIEHTASLDTDVDDIGASSVCHSVPAPKSDSKTGVHVGVARVSLGTRYCYGAWCFQGNYLKSGCQQNIVTITTAERCRS